VNGIRITLSCIFSVLHLAFSILQPRPGKLGLDHPWPLLQHPSRLVSHLGAGHLYIDRIYLGFTCFYMGVLSLA
jgi:hypothetical protein